MATCPYCDAPYTSYQIVGILAASEHLTDWLDPVPVASLFCESCGRYTFVHPDHPDVQRMHKGEPYERHQESIRTLNVHVGEIGDPELRQQFEHGCDEP